MPKVIVIGGGVAGMSAAHELVERGFQVEVFERNPKYVGGKARSVDAPGTNKIDPALFLPGEHGFRFFPGFYKHVTDTMKRIPVGDDKSAFDNLVVTETMMMAQSDAKPIVLPVDFPTSLKEIEEFFKGFQAFNAELSDEEIAFFSGKMWQLMTSCSQRFADEYDSISWWDYTEAATKSEAYQRLLSGGLTRSLVACQAQTASTRTCGAILLQMLYMMMDPFTRDTDRVFNAPTNDAWLNPWYDYLVDKGVKYHHGTVVSSIQTKDGRISGITFEKDGDVGHRGSPDEYYLLAVPVERAANLMSEDILKLDPSLKNIIKLAPNVQWMNGIQFYLNTEVNLNRGHTMYTGSNWALTSISQIQFWPDYDLSHRGNGKVVSILSVDISNWVDKGNFNGKAARDCTKEEIKTEVWEQLKQELNFGGANLLRDEMIEDYYLDEDIEPTTAGMSKTITARLSPIKQEALAKVIELEPLLVNQCDTWGIRPNAHTGIKNLFLASDYVKTNTDLATMEGANEAARRAVNSMLLASDSDEDYCEIWEMHTPFLLKPLQALDRLNFEKGLPWSQVL
ncbi:MAG: FAD-dependent oxidoreductase [Pseudomonadota bacterium]